ncbi:unnamed protein product [Oreochromis niloticus]|nr:unnamed protein product [Mustela putorius furo]
MNEEEEDTVAEMEPRAVKITPKAMEEKLQRVVNLRKAKLAKLTGTVKQVRQLMENECDASLAEATQLMKDFNERFGEFCDLNTNVKEVLQQMPEEDLTKDQEKWFEPKADSFKAFAETASAWIDKMAMRAVEAEKCNEDVNPSDSISNASVSKRSDKAFSERGSCASSSVSSTRMKAEVERATLLIKASSLRQKRLLEEREAKLQAEKEELEIQTALAANEAKIKILSEYESRASKASSRVAANRISVSKLDELWDQQFKSDFPECERNEKQEMSREDLQFLEIATESATIVDGHYSIALPLRNKRIKMPNNRKVAEQRALHLKRKLERNTPFHTEYSAFMSNIITKGYAVKVPEKDLGRDDGKVWYLPHHGVYHPKKHKLRVVFDCGASYKGTTLNDQLLQGPNLTSTLLGVIIRFRQEEVAIMADVEAMFHQVKVPDEDSDLLRFLWWTSGDITQKIVEYKMVVHIFGATSSPSCASFALRKCAEDNRDPANSQAVDTVLHNFYVDDCLKAVSSEEEAIQLYHTLRAVCQRGGFRLTKWISNSRAVLSAIPEEERASEVKDFDLDQDTLPIERALGVQWCIQSDSFRFKIVMPDRALWNYRDYFT